MLTRVTFLFDPAGFFQRELSGQQDAAKVLELQLRPISTPRPDAIDQAFAELGREGTEGVTAATQPMMTQESARIAAAALAHGIPTVGYHPGMLRCMRLLFAPARHAGAQTMSVHWGDRKWLAHGQNDEIDPDRTSTSTSIVLTSPYDVVSWPVGRT